MDNPRDTWTTQSPDSMTPDPGGQREIELPENFSPHDASIYPHECTK